MASSNEERLRFAESLLGALLRERAGVANDRDLELLEDATLRARGLPPAAAAVAIAAPPVEVPEPVGIRFEPGPRGWVDPMEDEPVPAAREVARVQAEEERETSPLVLWFEGKLNATPGDWIARAGMALLLLGVAFLCKYSIDRGWITPAIRVSAGGAIGAALLTLGIRTHRDAKPFSALLLGGGIGAWYISAYASFTLYHLVPFPVAVGLMTLTTLAAYGLALWSGVELLAVAGALGGLATPFLLPSAEPSVPGLTGYLTFILALTSGVYLARGWRKALGVGAVGMWFALTSVGPKLPPIATNPFVDGRIALTLGYVAVLLAGWAVFLLPRLNPHLRRAAVRGEAARAEIARQAVIEVERVEVWEGYVAVVVSFAAAWFSVANVWEMGDTAAGYVGAGIAAVGFLVHLFLRERRPGLARAHAFLAALAAAPALVLVSGDLPQAAAALVGFGTLLHAWHGRLPVGRPIRWLAHLSMVSAFVMASAALAEPLKLPYRIAVAAAAACAYAVAAEWTSGLAERTRDRYRGVGHAAAVLLVWALCQSLVHTSGWFTGAMAALAVALYVVERRGEDASIPGRPVDGYAAVAMQCLALTAVLWFTGGVGSGTTAWLNERAAGQLALLASLGAGAALTAPGRRRDWLMAGAYLLWLFTAADQFAGVTGGQALTTATWAATGLGLLLYALPRRDQRQVRVALGTLGLVCAKLLLIDLANLDPIWRILVFIGVGVAFLAVSYHVRSAWLSDADGEAAPAKPTVPTLADPS
ncbi:MAG TPA: DUF2339 domain-containing protein [Longimicrobium sp.]|nr:DUF2339 domain-containing protein [Longimicrobium sp.]